MRGSTRRTISSAVAGSSETTWTAKPSSVEVLQAISPMVSRAAALALLIPALDSARGRTVRRHRTATRSDEHESESEGVKGPDGEYRMKPVPKLTEQVEALI